MDVKPTPAPTLKNLCPEDARVLDLLIEARIQASAAAANADGRSAASVQPPPLVLSLPDQDLPRGKKIAQLLNLVGRCPAGTPPLDLVQQTMARVDRLHLREVEALRDQQAPFSFNVRWAELGTAAAVIVIGLSLLIPVLNRLRSDARRVACADNLALTGVAMGEYAVDNDMHIPRRDVVPGNVWWNVGANAQAAADAPVESNSAHLYQLVRGNYIEADALNCPANPNAVRGLSPTLNDWPNREAVSYSYQNVSRESPRIDRFPGMALLADKNPLFVAAPRQSAGMITYNPALSPTSPSPLHGQGQNILQFDGHAFWSTTPILPNGDNIWLANGVDHYTGTEGPTTPDDSFLVP